jgi:hypothetical protein
LPYHNAFNSTDVQKGFSCYRFVPKSNIPIKGIVLDVSRGGVPQNMKIMHGKNSGRGYFFFAPSFFFGNITSWKALPVR